MINMIENKTHPKIWAKFAENEKGTNEIVKIVVGDLVFDFLSKGEQPPLCKLEEALCLAIGLPDVASAMDFLLDLVRSLPRDFTEQNFNNVLSQMQALRPKDIIEAKLIAQHLILNEMGLCLLRKGFKNDMLFQADFYYRNASKLLNLSQQSVHVLMKYRNKGTQQINIVHMNDNAKAIMATELRGGDK